MYECVRMDGSGINGTYIRGVKDIVHGELTERQSSSDKSKKQNKHSTVVEIHDIQDHCWTRTDRTCQESKKKKHGMP